MDNYSGQPYTNGKSIAALVLGVVSLIIPLLGALVGIAAFSFAGVALREIRYRGGDGRGMAIAGLVCGIVATVLYGLLGLVLYLIGTYSDPAPVNPEPSFINV